MSSLFNLKIPAPEKPVSHHPWEKVIKDEFSHRVKYVHNSVKNPKYPKKEEKVDEPVTNRVRFTVYGNRVTKEFIYCTAVVKGLHKYRKNKFDAPIIRGVTSVEWPSIWTDLKIRYGELAFCLHSQVAVVLEDTFIGGEVELKEYVESQYVYHLCLDYGKEGVDQFAAYVKSSGRPCAYFHFSINDEEAGCMIFMLYADILPYTSENFLRLCKATRGGYGGTPVHRIVKDGWIQCGGFALKNNKDLGCENFMVPHDRRGVLCMANDGRHVDCSTQFFILLQPAPWMDNKYVAFGQLIDGESTLEKIEKVPTFYEAPTKTIKIYRSGILNMDCHGITINKKAKEYIFGHIDDLFVVGKLFYEELMTAVLAAIDKRELEKEEVSEEMLVEVTAENERDAIKDSKRFKKEDIEKQIGKNHEQHVSDRGEAEEYNYDYEYEGSVYKHASIGSASNIVKPDKPFYLPLTDVPYPGEVDSTYDLKKFLRGDYCHETDLDEKQESKKKKAGISYPSELLVCTDSSDEESDSSVDMDSDEEKEIKQYLSENVDHVSFGGFTVKKISKGFGGLNLFKIVEKPDLITITDEVLRRVRTMAIMEANKHKKKVSVSIAEDEEKVHHKIKRRQTGFVRPTDVERIRMIARLNEQANEEEIDERLVRKVRITPEKEPAQPKVSTFQAPRSQSANIARRPTGFVRPSMLETGESDVVAINRPSVLQRLYDDVMLEADEDVPTLKDYRTRSELTQTHKKGNLLKANNDNALLRNESQERYYRPSMLPKEVSPENFFTLQHSKKIARKISSDYVKTIDQIEQRKENSIRSIEFAKSRPTLSVTEYQNMNSKYQNELKSSIKQGKSSGGLDRKKPDGGKG